MIQRPRKSGSSEGTDSYLGSVSDLMAGLVFIFIIAIAVFALRLAETQAIQKTEIDRLTGLEKTRAEILKTIQNRLTDMGLAVEIDTEHGVLRLPEEGVRFALGRAEPRPEDNRNVGMLAAVLNDVVSCYVSETDLEFTNLDYFSQPPQPSQTPSWCHGGLPYPIRRPCGRESGDGQVETLLIEGHTDRVPIRGGRFRDNLELSAARAAQVFRMLTACEPELLELHNIGGASVLSVSGYGESRPVALPPGESASSVDLRRTAKLGEEINRRIDLRFMMEFPPDIQAQLGEQKPVVATRRGMEDQ